MDAITRQAAPAASLVDRAAAGDTVAFARIVAAYHADMVRVAYVVAGGDQALAEDAVQSAWSIAWRKLGSVRDPERVKAWLLSVAANEARQACRRERRHMVVQIAVSDADPLDTDPADRSDELDLERALRSLSLPDRTLLALRYEAGLGSSDIGALVHRPAATVRWQLARLRARLRKELTDG
jgi:RNA polymerase sigma-70 factor (ECF subfamily)